MHVVILSLIFLITTSIHHVYASNSCQIKVSSGKKVYLAGGEAIGLFEKYLEEASKKGLKINLRSLEVVYWDGKTEHTIKPGWGTIFSGETPKAWWRKELKNKEAKLDPNRVSKALQYGWDVVCIASTASASAPGTQEMQSSQEKTSQEKPTPGKGVCTEEAKQHINLGLSFIKTKDPNNAIKEFQYAVQVSPGCPLAYANLASAYVVKGNYNIAVDTYKEGLNRAGEDAFLHVTGALAHTKKGEYDYALSALDKALKLGYKEKKVLEDEFNPLFKKRKKDFCELLDKYGIILKKCL